MSNTIVVGMGSKEAIDKVTLLAGAAGSASLPENDLATVIGQLEFGDGMEFGVDWLNQYTKTSATSGPSSSFFQKRSDVIANNNITDLRRMITPAFGPASGFNLDRKLSDTVETYVTALETTNKFKVISRQRLRPQQQEGDHYLRSARPRCRSNPSPPQGNNNNGTVTTTVDFKDVVLKLEVVPPSTPTAKSP